MLLQGSVIWEETCRLKTVISIPNLGIALPHNLTQAGISGTGFVSACALAAQ